MKTAMPLLIFIALLSSCGQSNSTLKKKTSEIQNSTSVDKEILLKSDNQNKENKTEDAESEDKPILDFEQLYPTLKKSLLKNVCEPCKSEDGKNTLEAVSKETGMFLSRWVWDLKNTPLLVKDIDNDGLVDYTIELYNQGGGCGGNVEEKKRWTLFGSKPDRFKKQ